MDVCLKPFYDYLAISVNVSDNKSQTVIITISSRRIILHHRFWIYLLIYYTNHMSYEKPRNQMVG